MRSGGRGRGAYYKHKYGNSGRLSHETASTQSQDPVHARSLAFSSNDTRGSSTDLATTLRGIDGRAYKAYHDIEGAWSFSDFTLVVDWVQGDPYASPSRCHVNVPAAIVAIPSTLWSSRIRREACCDFLSRSFAKAVTMAGPNEKRITQGHQGGGWHGEKGGDISVEMPGQHVIQRSSVILHHDGAIEARFTVCLPARGRAILGEQALSVLVHDLPRYVRMGLCYASFDNFAIKRHVQCVEDTETLRTMLPKLGLVSFVGNGAILPRRTGANEEPMPADSAVVFKSPENLEVEISLPNRGAIRGMGIQQGVTLICGGGFHGKSTLLEAIENGVYNKIPGDGRELVVTDPTAVKIRAEDGRRVQSVDISPFISNLPMGRCTQSFSSEDASGSTSQAANIQEALEAGAKLLLIDEDTSATNFMVRDARMCQLVAPEREPITPFVARVKALARSGVSSILVIGATGQYFSEADCVIVMDTYVPEDATKRAKDIIVNDGKYDAEKFGSTLLSYPPVPERTIRSLSSEYQRDIRCKVRGISGLVFGEQELDLTGVEQLVEVGQTRAIGGALVRLMQGMLGPWWGAALPAMLDLLEAEIDGPDGLDVLAGGIFKPGNLSRPRRYEIAAAVNRLRCAVITQQRTR